MKSFFFLAFSFYLVAVVTPTYLLAAQSVGNKCSVKTSAPFGNLCTHYAAGFNSPGRMLVINRIIPLSDQVVFLQGQPGMSRDESFLYSGATVPLYLRNKRPWGSQYSDAQIRQSFATTNQGLFAITDSNLFEPFIQKFVSPKFAEKYEIPDGRILISSGLRSLLARVGGSDLLAFVTAKSENTFALNFFDTEAHSFSAMDFFASASLDSVQLISGPAGQVIAIINASRSWKPRGSNYTLVAHFDSHAKIVRSLTAYDLAKTLNIPIDTINENQVSVQSFAFDESSNTFYGKLRRSSDDDITTVIAWNLNDGSFSALPVVREDDPKNYCAGRLARVAFGKMLCLTVTGLPMLTDLTTFQKEYPAAPHLWSRRYFSNDYKVAVRADSESIFVTDATSMDPRQWKETKLPFSLKDTGIRMRRVGFSPDTKKIFFSGDDDLVDVDGKSELARFWEIF